MSDHSGPKRVLGIDLSDKKFDACLLDLEGEIARRSSEALTFAGLRKVLDCDEPLLVILEAGTHSGWVSRFSEAHGHETLVANPRRLPLIYMSSKKNDRNDAENLARLGHLQPSLLSPIEHRGEQAQADLSVVRSRDLLVRSRASLVGHVRCVVKSFGERIPSCSTATFHKVAPDSIPDVLAAALLPMVNMIALLTKQIQGFDRAIEKLCEVSYKEETDRVRQVTGVGSLTALAFVLLLEDPSRFKNSRAVGCYLGLTPKQDQSGESRKQLRITKQGDALLRRLLVGSAHYILGPFGPDCDLRRWGEALMKRGGGNAKKRAVVAVARRLSVLLHSLWKTGEEYDPLLQSRRADGRAA